MDTINSKTAEFRQRVEKEWKGAEPAAAWQKHYSDMRKQFAELTRKLMETANPQPGMSVLDLASGTGEPALPIASRVAPDGKVVATDLSEEMLKMLKQNADEQGISNIETHVADAESLPFEDGTFDLVTSRFGIMFFAEAERALSEIRRVLKPNGRAIFMVWGKPEPGSYFGTVALPFIMRLAEKPDPDGPGPMRFAEPDKLAALLRNIGYSDVQEIRDSMSAPYPGTPEQLLISTFEIAAPFRTIAASLSEEDRSAAEKEALDNLNSHYDGEKVNINAPIVIVTGKA